MIKFLTKLCFNIRHRGLVSLTLMVCVRLIQKIIPFELLLFFEKSLNEPIKLLDTKNNVFFKHGKYADIQDLNIKEYHLSGLESYEIRHNCDCYIGVKDKVLFYIWVGYNNIYDDKIFDVELNSKQAYLYRAFTHPGHRGLRIYPAGLSYVCQELKKKNIEKCFIAASFENRSSIKGIYKAGFLKVGYVTYFKLHNYRKVRLPKILQALAT